jgi:hypothetical protein
MILTFFEKLKKRKTINFLVNSLFSFEEAGCRFCCLRGWKCPSSGGANPEHQYAGAREGRLCASSQVLRERSRGRQNPYLLESVPADLLHR